MKTSDVIMDEIQSGQFDKELGAMARDPEYAEYTAIELKSLLHDRVLAGTRVTYPVDDAVETLIYGGIIAVVFIICFVLSLGVRP